MKPNQSNCTYALQGKDDNKNLAFNGRKDKLNSLKYQYSSTKIFLLKIGVLIAIILGVGLSKSKAQVKGVWGNPKKAHYQKIGESYVGVITGSGLTPTGASAFINISQGSAIHTYYGFKGSALDFDLNRGSVFGLSYQPRINFRTGNLNAGYYFSIGGEMNNYNQKISSNPTRDINNSESITQKQAITDASLIIGLGAFFEVSEKWQVFVERTARLDCHALSTPAFNNMYYTSVGFRVFTLKGKK